MALTLYPSQPSWQPFGINQQEIDWYSCQGNANTDGGIYWRIDGSNDEEEYGRQYKQDCNDDVNLSTEESQ